MPQGPSRRRSSAGEAGHEAQRGQCSDQDADKPIAYQAYHLAGAKAKTETRPAEPKARPAEPKPAPKIGANKVTRIAKEEVIDEEKPKLEARQVKLNYAMMVNDTLSRRLSGYRSDEDPSDVSEPESDFTMISSTAQPSAGLRPKRSEFRLALSTILKALEDDSDAEEKLKHRIKKDGRDVKVSAQEMMAALPHISKQEKKQLHKQLKKEQEEIAAKHMSKPVKEDTLRRAESAGYHSGSASTPARSSTDRPAAPAPPSPKVPRPVRKKHLQEFRKALYDNALDRQGTCIPSQASEVPEGIQVSCKHEFSRLRWGANQSAH